EELTMIREEIESPVSNISSTSSTIQIPICFGCEVEYFVNNMFCGEEPEKPFVPTHLLSNLWEFAPLLDGYQEQDAHEFYNTLINALHSHTCEIKKNPQTNIISVDKLHAP